MSLSSKAFEYRAQSTARNWWYANPRMNWSFSRMPIGLPRCAKRSGVRSSRTCGWHCGIRRQVIQRVRCPPSDFGLTLAFGKPPLRPYTFTQNGGYGLVARPRPSNFAATAILGKARRDRRATWSAPIKPCSQISPSRSHLYCEPINPPNADRLLPPWRLRNTIQGASQPLPIASSLLPT